MSKRRNYGDQTTDVEGTDETMSETDGADAQAEVTGTPEQLTAAVRFLAARIGGAAATEVDFLLGVPPETAG